MEVHKFGGASIRDAERIRKVGALIQHLKFGPKIIVVSAMGKTTNALEKVAEAFFQHQPDLAIQQFELIKQNHLELTTSLLSRHAEACRRQLLDFFTEAEWLLHDKPVQSFDYYYDQLVGIGELLSSTIISWYLREIEIPHTWMDARDIIQTNRRFREGGILWPETSRLAKDSMKPLLDSVQTILTQGFIGCTQENETTTLGREGSDFSGAIFAHILQAESLTIWKDVPAVMNADPNVFSNTVPLSQLSYAEVIEMAYYGAQVIHPKTIQPLSEKRIPLQVKCFLDPSLPGTTITYASTGHLPPILVKKSNQVMAEFISRDFSFAADHWAAALFQLFERSGIRPNLTQIGAIRMIAVFNQQESGLEQLLASAAEKLDVTVRKNLELFTVRHGTLSDLGGMTEGKKIWLQQQTSDTIQLLAESAKD